MKTFVIVKAGKKITIQGEDACELTRRLYAAGDGPGSVLSPIEAAILTDRLEVLEGNDEPGVFSWTEDITADNVKAWKDTGTASVSLVPEQASTTKRRDEP